MKKEIKYGSIVQLVRTLVCHIRGRGFKSRWNRHKTWKLGSINNRLTGRQPKENLIVPTARDLIR